MKNKIKNFLQLLMIDGLQYNMLLTKWMNVGCILLYRHFNYNIG